MQTIIDMLKQEYHDTEHAARAKMGAIHKALVALGVDLLNGTPVLGTSSSQGLHCLQVDLLPDSKLLEQHLKNYKKAKKMRGKKTRRSKRKTKVISQAAPRVSSIEDFEAQLRSYKHRCTVCSLRFKTYQALGWHIRRAVDKAHGKYRDKHDIKYSRMA